MSWVNLDDVYVNKSGDSIAGNLSVGGALTINDGKGTNTTYNVANEITTLRDSVSQMVVGQVLRPTATIYSGGFDVGTITADRWVVNQLFAVCMPASNGVYVARVFGCLLATVISQTDAIERIDIEISSVKMPNREEEVSTFISPGKLGFTTTDSFYGFPVIQNTGLQFGVIVRDSTESSIAVTDSELTSRTDVTLLNCQELFVSPATHHLTLTLSQINVWP